MKLSTQIVKELMLPHLINDEGFNHFKINENDWDELTEGFVKYSIDTKPLYKSIYALNLNDPESIIDTIPEVYESFIEEIAEQYVLKNNTDASEYLLKNKVSEFLEHLVYLSELQNAITAAERKNLKIQIPEEAGFLDFGIPDEDLEQSIKKNAREELKDKMHQWDHEMADNKGHIFFKKIIKKEKVQQPAASFSEGKKTIKFQNWFKYVAAAAILIFIVLYFYPTSFTPQKMENYYAANYDNFDISIPVSTMQQYSEETRQGALPIEIRATFDANNFELLKKQLNDLGVNSSEKTDLLVFLAIAQLNTNEIDKSIENLEYLYKDKDYQFIEDVEFHLAIAYFYSGHKEKSVNTLKSINRVNHKYSEYIKELLNKLD